jgi:hypothetical protein
MQLNDILNKFDYNDITYEEDNTIVVENNYKIAIMLFINHEDNQYAATFSDEYEFKQLAEITSNNYDEFLKLLEVKLELNNPFWTTMHI